MMMSPGSIRSASWSMEFPVISPAGTITHAARGLVRAATNSSRDAVPVAPSLASCCIGPGLRS